MISTKTLNRIITAVTLLLLFSTVTYADTSTATLEKANQSYEEKNYSDAITQYNRAIELGADNGHVYISVAELIRAFPYGGIQLGNFDKIVVYSLKVAKILFAVVFKKGNLFQGLGNKGYPGNFFQFFVQLTLNGKCFALSRGNFDVGIKTTVE